MGGQVQGGSADQKMGLRRKLGGKEACEWAMVEEYGVDLKMTVRGVP